MVAIATDRLTKVFDDGTIAVDDVSLEARSGEFLVLLGPTGCGKSTILRLVAGLEEATSGHVLLDGEVVDGLDTRDRRIAMVFQDYALYPHLTVAQNIGFPLRAEHETPDEITARVAEVAEELGIADLLRRLPRHLSGGQRQRVAMARAIARRPRAFLLDEPLSNVDAGLRAELRADVATLARRLRVTTLYVTHDQSEALAMADRVAVLRRGRLEQIGPPGQVYDDPASLFVAAFLGTPRTNLLQGAVYADGGRVVLDLGSQVIELPSDDPRLAALAARHTERVTVALRADALAPVAADAAAGPVLRGAVRAIENLGHEALVRLTTGMLPTSVPESRLELPDTGQHLSDVLADEPPRGHPVRHTLSRMIPHQRQDEPPATARTEYGFYPVYEAERSAEPSPGELVVRVPSPRLPRRGEPMTVAVDLDRLLLFDRGGARIRLDRP
ncbi:multiple sugar transport system ATP-binding protein [Micromonospora pattaloongensis]|uniref:Multiple sugar transport system ATP-binding protein n=1 Tax=Micromonospora pattaloongensis TaxID=405436 RepID=A0A1H3FXF3_9ACTN|nr:ABC transporter ATP-binding protein [Micromonospora pattaloongensis]SDX95773.1 multiple sugar transport system ATP-binding protein [Micromonospora pattaloongensis]